MLNLKKSFNANVIVCGEMRATLRTKTILTAVSSDRISDFERSKVKQMQMYRADNLFVGIMNENM